MSRWLRAMIVVALVTASLAALAVTVAPSDNLRWPIRWLEVDGELTRVTSAQVRAALAPEAGRGFFAVDVDRARAAVESLPWVARAQVSRRWPDTLSVAVHEHRPVARWNGSALISDRGESFTVAGTAGMQGLVQLHGPESSLDSSFEHWRRLQTRLGTQGLEIRRLSRDARGAWTLELGSGLQLLLGREHLDDRIERFLAVRDELRAAGELVRVDLRYPNGLAVQRAAPRPPGPQPVSNPARELQDRHG
ncbi:MAG: FtsQ-type POTRA domain-containing protein [Wenzhouxiangellaceae bacterium]|nr:FtsQ-type POTRA domain-containing protein [Wenzhouxiangellaceae bacterium]